MPESRQVCLLCDLEVQQNVLVAMIVIAFAHPVFSVGSTNHHHGKHQAPGQRLSSLQTVPGAPVAKSRGSGPSQRLCKGIRGLFAVSFTTAERQFGITDVRSVREGSDKVFTVQRGRIIHVLFHTAEIQYSWIPLHLFCDLSVRKRTASSSCFVGCPAVLA